MRVKTNDEVRRDIFKKLSDLKDLILGNLALWIRNNCAYLFKNHQRLDCGLTGDVHLMSNQCHMEKEFVHPVPGQFIRYHTMEPERYYKEDGPTNRTLLGILGIVSNFGVAYVVKKTTIFLKSTIFEMKPKCMIFETISGTVAANH